MDACCTCTNVYEHCTMHADWEMHLLLLIPADMFCSQNSIKWFGYILYRLKYIHRQNRPYFVTHFFTKRSSCHSVIAYAHAYGQIAVSHSDKWGDLPLMGWLWLPAVLRSLSLRRAHDLPTEWTDVVKPLWIGVAHGRPLREPATPLPDRDSRCAASIMTLH